MSIMSDLLKGVGQAVFGPVAAAGIYAAFDASKREAYDAIVGFMETPARIKALEDFTLAASSNPAVSDEQLAGLAAKITAAKAAFNETHDRITTAAAVARAAGVPVPVFVLPAKYTGVTTPAVQSGVSGLGAAPLLLFAVLIVAAGLAVTPIVLAYRATAGYVAEADGIKATIQTNIERAKQGLAPVTVPGVSSPISATAASLGSVGLLAAGGVLLYLFMRSRGRPA